MSAHNKGDASQRLYLSASKTRLAPMPNKDAITRLGLAAIAEFAMHCHPIRVWSTTCGQAIDFFFLVKLLSTEARWPLEFRQQGQDVVVVKPISFPGRRVPCGSYVKKLGNSSSNGC